jgi:hypothetical protein
MPRVVRRRITEEWEEQAVGDEDLADESEDLESTSGEATGFAEPTRSPPSRRMPPEEAGARDVRAGGRPPYPDDLPPFPDPRKKPKR